MNTKRNARQFMPSVGLQFKPRTLNPIVPNASNTPIRIPGTNSQNKVLQNGD